MGTKKTEKKLKHIYTHTLNVKKDTTMYVNIFRRPLFEIRLEIRCVCVCECGSAQTTSQIFYFSEKEKIINETDK